MNEQQTQQADDPSGPGWRWVRHGEKLELHDMMQADGEWWPTKNAGETCLREGMYRRRIEPQQQTQPEPNPDDPAGDGWRWVRRGEALSDGDVEKINGGWRPTIEAGYTCPRNHSYRRRIEPQQPSDSEPENAELQQLREQVRDLTRQAQLDAVELQQLREQVATLTRERDRYRNQLSGAIEHGGAPEAQTQLVDRLQKWLRPVLEVVSDHPDHSSILAVSVLEFLPQIASRLIEE